MAKAISFSTVAVIAVLGLAAPNVQAATYELDLEELRDRMLNQSGVVTGSTPGGALTLPGLESEIFSRQFSPVLNGEGLFFEELQQYLDQRIKVMDLDGPTRRLLAFRLYQDGRLDEAVAVLEEILRIEGDDAKIAMDLVRIEQQRGGDAAARGALVRFADAYADPFPFRLSLARLDHDAGLNAAAIAGLETLASQTLSADRLTLVRLILARYLIESDDIARAAEVVDALLTDTPDEPHALAFQGAVLRAQGQMARAQQSIKRGLGIDPDNLSLLRQAYQLAQEQGAQAEAESYLKAAVEASNYAPDLTMDYAGRIRRDGDLAELERLFEASIAARPDLPGYLVALGQAQLDQRNWDAAEQTAARLRGYGSPGALRDSEMIRVGVLKGRGQAADAMGLLRQLSGAGADIGALAALVQSYLADGRVAEAADSLDKVLAQTPENPAALMMRASVHALADETEAAETALRRVVDLVPNSPAGHLSLARHFLREGAMDQTEEAIRAGLRVLPANPQLRMTLVEILVEDDRPGEALGVLDGLVTAFPGNALVANNYVAVVTDHFVDDPDRMARAVDLSEPLATSDNPRLKDTYAWLLHLTGDSQQALGLLQDVVKAEPENPWANYHLGMAAKALGDLDLAQTHLRRAAETTDARFSKAPQAIAALASLEN